MALSAVSAVIDDLAEPLLRIEGQAAGAAQDMLRFVNDSPVSERIDRFAADTVAGGTAALELALQLPLREPQASRVQGTVRLAGNPVALDPALPRLEGVTGRIAFTESSLALHDLRAGFLGGSVRISAQTVEPG